MFCPDTESKKCIGYLCPAYGYSKPSLCECEVCKQQFTIGGSCTQKGHSRLPIILKEYPYCNKYKVDIQVGV